MTLVLLPLALIGLVGIADVAFFHGAIGVRVAKALGR